MSKNDLTDYPTFSFSLAVLMNRRIIINTTIKSNLCQTFWYLCTIRTPFPVFVSLKHPFENIFSFYYMSTAMTNKNNIIGTLVRLTSFQIRTFIQSRPFHYEISATAILLRESFFVVEAVCVVILPIY